MLLTQNTMITIVFPIILQNSMITDEYVAKNFKQMIEASNLVLIRKSYINVLI